MIAIFADRFARGDDVQIFGDGQQTRDFIYVTDVVAHLMAAMKTSQRGDRVLNVCTGHPTSILELAQIIARIAGREARIRHGAARIGDIRASVGDPSAARSVLGVAAKTKITDGLRATLAHVASAAA